MRDDPTTQRFSPRSTVANGSGEALFRSRIRQLLQSGAPRAAQVKLEAALRHVALRSPAMLMLAAELWRARGEKEDAFECLREAYDLDPGNVEVARAVFDHAPESERRVRAEQLLSFGAAEVSCRSAALMMVLENDIGVIWLFQAGARVVVDVATKTNEEIALLIRRRHGNTTLLVRPTVSDSHIGFHFISTQLDFEQSDFLAIEAPEGFVIFGSPALFVSPDSVPSLGLRGAPVCVVVPLFRDTSSSRTCIEALLSDADYKAGLFDVLLVDDSGGNELVDYARYQSNGCRLVTNPINLGFVGAVNYALSQLADVDVLLLNSDTLPPPGLARRLCAVSAIDSSIGLVTALSNNAEYGCFPRPFEANPCPEHATALAFDAGFAAVHNLTFVEMPAATGFCLLITASCRRVVGLLDPIYRRGYLEDIDYCLRARRFGFRCVCALGVYVAHEGSASFGAEKRHLVQWNARTLVARHPQFQHELANFRARNIWLEPFERAERYFWPRQRVERLVVVGREMAHRPDFDRAAKAARFGINGLAWCEVSAVGNGGCKIAVWAEDGSPPQSLGHRFFVHASPESIRAWFTILDIGEAIFLDPAATPIVLVDVIRSVADRWSLAAVDLGLICPRGSAHLPTGRFCGIPDNASDCETCIAHFGTASAQKVDARTYRDFWRARLLENNKARFVDPPAQSVAQMHLGHPTASPSISKMRRPQSEASGFAFLAIRARLGSMRAFSELLEELKCLNADEPEILLAGEAVTIEGLQAGRVNVIAPVSRGDIEALLDRLDIGSIFVIDREAIFNDPLISAIYNSGRRIGGYSWGGVGAIESVGDLIIDGFAPLPWSARTISRWRTAGTAR